MYKIATLIITALTATLMPTQASEKIDVSLDLNQTGEPIHPFIYGQFIEHLGRCIYGGIWAEMLEDRKFYFPVTKDYDPYQKLEDTDFPVVGASPWEIIGNKNRLEMVTENSFVGEHTPRIDKDAGIRQRDLGVVAGKAYDGYIWLKNATDARSAVTLSFANQLNRKSVNSETVIVPAGDYTKFPFTFEAKSDSDTATLSIEVERGAVFVGAVSLMPEDNIQGMRADTLALLKELDSPTYRWPGGNFVSGYNWRDGIGDRDRRPPRKNPAWMGIEHNDFGTDEFIAFCRYLDTEPTIAANTGFGDAYSAAQWVEYCNRGGDTIGGQWRIDNGHKEPYDVKYWCIGNEMWGPWQHGFMQLSHYVLKHNRVVNAMRAVDEDIVSIAVGAVDQINADHDPAQAEANLLWSVGMMKACHDHMEFISEHFYSGRTPWTDSEELAPIEHVMLMKEQIRRIASEHRRLQPEIEELDGKTIPIAMDEWNYWHRDYQYGELGCVYDLKDALGTVAALHEYYRQSDIIKIANYAQTVNVIGCIKTTKTEAGFATTGIPLKLYRAEWQNIPLKLPDEHAPYDIAAARSENGKVLTVSIVNPTDEDSRVNLNLNGARLPQSATRWIITGPGHRAVNVPGEDPLVDADRANNVDISKGFAVPALSSALYRLEL